MQTGTALVLLRIGEAACVLLWPLGTRASGKGTLHCAALIAAQPANLCNLLHPRGWVSSGSPLQLLVGANQPKHSSILARAQEGTDAQRDGLVSPWLSQELCIRDSPSRPGLSHVGYLPLARGRAETS